MAKSNEMAAREKGLADKSRETRKISDRKNADGSLPKGVCTALITPFEKGGAVDFAALENLVRLQHEAGVENLLLFGSTGESATLTFSEREEIVARVRRLFSGTLIVGCGCNDTRRALSFALQAKAAGADLLLAVTPYYNKCTQAGAVAYYETLAEAGLPLLCYNVPARTGFDLAADSVKHLFRRGAVCGVKEASGSIKRVQELIFAGVPVFSGDDSLNLSAFLLGARGTISVVSNLAPAALVRQWRAVVAGDMAAARAVEKDLMSLNAVLYREVNPIPVKAALHMMGLCDNVLRAPLTPLSSANERAVLRALIKAHVLH